jgi:hypothetical protein
VTEGLLKKFGPYKVADFPPDETTLMGVGIGYAQCGLVPVVEIPYSKYLDCGADMFFEACIQNWLSGGILKKDQNGKITNPNVAGMVIRLQGFDKGVFGGNFHTHNSLYLPPGLDVVCFSNGADYVRGMRHAIAAARKGRVVMTVDSTELLNRRHLDSGNGVNGAGNGGNGNGGNGNGGKPKGDDGWITQYPTDSQDYLDFETVKIYAGGDAPPGITVADSGVAYRGDNE